MSLGEFGGSALTDKRIAVPERGGPGIPVTYVPARNTVFLSLGLGVGRGRQRRQDRDRRERDRLFGLSGLPARVHRRVPSARAACHETRHRRRHARTIEAPLIDLSKADIIRRGVELGIDYSLTVSCYQADEQGRSCGRCDSCRLRQEVSSRLACRIRRATVRRAPRPPSSAARASSRRRSRPVSSRPCACPRWFRPSGRSRACCRPACRAWR